MSRPRLTTKQKDALRELERLARTVGLRVSFGDLRFAGLKLRGGQCDFRGEKWLVMDRKQSYEDQLAFYRDALSQFELNAEDLSPEVRAVLKRGPSLLADVPRHEIEG